MEQHEKALLSIIGRALFGAEIIVPPDTDFEALYKEAMAQAVPMLVFEHLGAEDKASLPPAALSVWQKQTMQLAIRNERLLAEQGEIIRLLRENGIPCAILKGSSAAASYPNPALRIMGDIDVLVSPENQQAAVRLLQQNGFGEVLEEEHHCHLTVKRNGFAAEIHNAPNGFQFIKDQSVSNALRRFFENALDSAEHFGEIPVLSAEHQAVVLLLHKLEHFLSGSLGLRQLCDWACFVDKSFSPELFGKLKPQLESFGMLEFCGVITRVCCEYLHLPYSRASWCTDYDKDLCAEVIEDILLSGNLGRKQQNYGERYFVDVDSAGRLSSFFYTLKTACYHHWSVCEKYKLLLCIAPFVIFAKYLKMRARGERQAIRPIELYKKAGPRRRLYKSLKPFVNK